MLGNGSPKGTNGAVQGRAAESYGAAQGHGVESHVEETSGGRELTLQDAVEVLFKNKWWILGCFVVVLAATAAYTAAQSPVYQTSSKVLVNNQSATPQLSEMLGMPQGAGGSNVANEVEILKSHTIAQRVADEVMDQRYVPGTQRTLSLLRTASDTGLTQRRVADRIARRLQVSPVARNVDLIDIEARSTIPKEAALIANLYAEEYTEYNREISSRRARESRRFLEGAVDSFAVNLRQQESDLQSFFNEQEVIAPDAEAKELMSQLSTLRQQRFQAELERGKAQTRLRQVQGKLDSIQPGLAESITNNDQMEYQALQQRITALETQQQEQFAANPDLRSNETQEIADRREKINSLREQVRQRAQSLSRDALSGSGVGIGGQSGGKLARVQALSESALSNRLDLQAAQAGVDAVDREVAALRGELEDLPQQEIVLSRLERSLSTSSSVYEDLQKRLYDARIAERSELGDVQIIDAALVPRSPVRPSIPSNLALGGFLGLILGVGLAFLRSIFDSKVRSPENLRDEGQAVLATVPDMQSVVESDFGGREYVDVEGHKYSTRLISLLNPLSPIAESYRQLRTNLQFSHVDSEVRIIAVTSAGPGEGKTVTATNLAVAMAQAGRRTLYLDADLRRASGHKVFGKSREPGLSDALFGASSHLASSRFETEVENLYMMPTGQEVPNPAEVIGSDKMKDFIDRLRHEFDVIVIDTPPVLAVTDPLLVARHCDAVITVYSANMTDQAAVSQTLDTLKRINTKPAGAVLNRFDPKSAYGSYGYGYGYGYGEYGGSDAPTSEEASLEKV